MSPLYSTLDNQWRIGFGLPRKSNPVNIRNGPGFDHEIIGNIRKDKLAIVEWNTALSQDGWCPVRVHTPEHLGYVCSGWMLTTHIAFLPIVHIRQP